MTSLAWWPPIGGLLSLSRPSAITGFVPFGVVNAVQRLACRSRAHVGQERHEVIPAVTNLDSGRAVSNVGRVSRIIATALHAAPRPVGRSICPAVFVRRRALTAVFSQLGARLIGVRTDEARTARSELPIVAQSVLGARTARFALQRGTMFRAQLLTGQRGADSLLALLADLMPTTSASRLTSRPTRPPMASACTSRFTFGHGPIIVYRRNLSLEEARG